MLTTLSRFAVALTTCATLLVAPHARAGQVHLSSRLGTPVVAADTATRTHLKVGLTGLRPVQAARTPVNVALVIDRSGSMAGRKLEEAKAAAISALDRLAPSDVVSVVTYDSSVQTVVAATDLRRHDYVRRAIRGIRAGGNTALFAGVSRGAHEVRKYLSTDRVNRIILLSDGLANIGPSSPGQLAELGRSLAAEGITVTTFGLGLGYNEDLMAQLAMASDGNHAFIESEDRLAQIFDYEFGDVLSVVGQSVDIEVQLVAGATVGRVLGREATVLPTRVRARLNQVYANQEKFVLAELNLPPLAHGERRRVGTVTVRYSDMVQGTRVTLQEDIYAEGTHNLPRIAQMTNRDVEIATAEALATEQNKVALALRDQGKVREAKEVLRKNSAYLQRKARKLRSKKLRALEADNAKDEKGLEQDWARTRKSMRKRQHTMDNQQAY